MQSGTDIYLSALAENHQVFGLSFVRISMETRLSVEAVHYSVLPVHVCLYAGYKWHALVIAVIDQSEFDVDWPFDVIVVQELWP